MIVVETGMSNKLLRNDYASLTSAGKIVAYEYLQGITTDARLRECIRVVSVSYSCFCAILTIMIDERVFGEDLSEFGGLFVDEVQRGYMFLYDHKQSWKRHVSFRLCWCPECSRTLLAGRYRSDARDKLRMGALGTFDNDWKDSNERMESVSSQVRDPAILMASANKSAVGGRTRLVQ